MFHHCLSYWFWLLRSGLQLILLRHARFFYQQTATQPAVQAIFRGVGNGYETVSTTMETVLFQEQLYQTFGWSVAGCLLLSTSLFLIRRKKFEKIS